MQNHHLIRLVFLNDPHHLHHHRLVMNILVLKMFPLDYLLILVHYFLYFLHHL
jgi:hypothetical protein